VSLGSYALSTDNRRYGCKTAMTLWELHTRVSFINSGTFYSVVTINVSPVSVLSATLQIILVADSDLILLICLKLLR